MRDDTLLNLLFICTKNQWRSPTAERVFAKDARVSVRSAGTSRRAKRKVSATDISWAHIIFVMEEKHKSRLRADFRNETLLKKLYVLDIPDDYKFMDPELMEIIRSKVESVILGAGEVR